MISSAAGLWIDIQRDRRIADSAAGCWLSLGYSQLQKQPAFVGFSVEGVKVQLGGGDWLLNRVRALLALLLMMLVQIYLFTDVFVSHLLCAVVLSVLNVAFQFKYVNVDHYWFYISWCFFLFTRGRFNPKKCNDINDNSLHCRSFTQGKVREGHEQWTPVMDELTVNNKTQEEQLSVAERYFSPQESIIK